MLAVFHVVESALFLVMKERDKETDEKWIKLSPGSENPETHYGKIILYKLLN